MRKQLLLGIALSIGFSVGAQAGHNSTSNVRDHRTQPVVRDHRSKPVVRDHRKPPVTLKFP